MTEKILILDFETDSLDTDTAKIKVVGIHTNTNDKIHCLWWNEDTRLKLQKIIKAADFVVTFNGNAYDIPVAVNQENKLFKYPSRVLSKSIDLYEVMLKRKNTFKEKFLNGMSLDAVCEVLGLGRKIKEFDYSLLQKDTFTDEEKAEIETYLRRDIELTRDLYKYLDNAFSAFKEFLPEKTNARKGHITLSPGSLAYKAVCHMTGLPEKYNDGAKPSDYKGGEVFNPTQEEAQGVIRCVDYASAYPHAFMQGNLYTHCKKNSCEKYNDGQCEYIFNGGRPENGKKLDLSGKYCTEARMGTIEQLIKKLFGMRADSKKILKTSKDPGQIDYHSKLQYAIKIIINTIYGLSGSPKFISLYDVNTAADCTRICRFNLNHLHARLKQMGYKVLYGDTDSAYLIDVYEDDTVLQDNLDIIINELKAIMPFPQDTFKLEIEDPIQYIKFFPNSDGTYKKKKYIILQDDNKVVVKGLQVIRSDSTLLARELWGAKIQPYIKENKSAQIPKKIVTGWIEELLMKDLSLAATEFKVKEFKEYKNPSQIQAQISKEYGVGRHLLIRNKRGLGIGKNVKYLPLKEAKDLPISDLDLARVYADLDDIIRPVEESLDRWFTAE